MQFRYVKPHKTLQKSGCVICGNKRTFDMVFMPTGSTRIYGYPLCGTCRDLAHKDPSLLDTLEDALIAGAVDTTPK